MRGLQSAVRGSGVVRDLYTEGAEVEGVDGGEAGRQAGRCRGLESSREVQRLEWRIGRVEFPHSGRMSEGGERLSAG